MVQSQLVNPSTDEAENGMHKNLILNINVTNSNKSKCFLNPFNCFIIVTFGVLLSLLLMFLQLQVLERQMHSHILKYQGKDNQNSPVETLNRLVDYNNSVRPVNISSIYKLFNQMKVRDDRHTDSVMTRASYYENNAINRSSLSDDARSISKMINLFNEFHKRDNFTNLLNGFNKKESFRDFPMQSYTKVEISSDHRSIIWSEPHMRTLQRMKRDSEEGQNKKESDKQQQNEEESNKQKDKEIQRRSKGKRETVAKGNTQRQNERKGEKQRQGKRRHNDRQSRPLVATFIGAQPELTNAVYIGPWIRKEFTNHKYNFNDFHLVEDNMAIEVQISGLYMLSVQIYYYGNLSFSYWVLLSSKGSSSKQKLITCATSSKTGVSCYTSIIVYLQRGDRLYLQQQEKNRLINMQDGYSQVQIMLLANDKKM